MKGIGIVHAGLVAACLLAVPLATPAQAQEGEFAKKILGSLGVIPEDKEPIDYRERPPLVLPPRMELREPVAPGSVQARNPQWPNDPDVVARKRQAIEDSTPLTETEWRRLDANSRLSAEEMRSGRRAGANVTTAPQSRSDRSWIDPDVLRAQHQQGSNGKMAGGDTTRHSLTEPPSAYRKSATGKEIKGSFEAPSRVDEADPKVFLREQARRNGQ